MAILNPDHLLDQAQRLIDPPPAGPPRQVDIRRAISSAYYAAFHAAISAAADQFVGVTLRATPEYGLVARSVDHATIKRTCEDISKSAVPPKYLAYIPPGGIGADIAVFAAAFPDLQEQRHAADYDPLLRFVTRDATSVIATSRSVIAHLRAAPTQERKAFLFLLLFPPKR